jgi:hypothetical protein
MPFLIAVAALFLALLVGTVIEFPRLCSEACGGLELSQARLVLSPRSCCRGLSPSCTLPWDYPCASKGFPKSVSSAARFDAFCHGARNRA